MMPHAGMGCFCQSSSLAPSETLGCLVSLGLALFGLQALAQLFQQGTAAAATVNRALQEGFNPIKAATNRSRAQLPPPRHAQATYLSVVLCELRSSYPNIQAYQRLRVFEGISWGYEVGSATLHLP